MGFSRSQQGEFRKLVRAAWEGHCRTEGGAAQDKAAERTWYAGELRAATGHESSTACNGARDYERAMAHFEALAGTGVKWGLRVFGGDAKRMLHALHAAGAGPEVDEDYLRGVARRMLKRDDLPELHTLPRETLVAIVGEVRRHVRRAAKRGAVNAGGGVVRAEDCPF